MNRDAAFLWGHGLMANCAVDDQCGLIDFQHLSEFAEIIRYDARGHGKSPMIAGRLANTWQAMADDMLTAINPLPSEQAIILGGQSMGAATSLWAALKSTKPIDGLILVTPPTAWQTRHEQIMKYQFMSTMFSNISRADLEALFTQAAPLPKYLLESRVDLLHSYIDNLYHQIETRLRELQWVLEGAIHSDFPSPDNIKKLDIPTLILAWEDDASHPVSIAEELNELMPNSRLSVASSYKDITLWSDQITGFIQSIKGQDLLSSASAS